MESNMTFNIDKISNFSPKTVLLTNPVSERDTHLVPIQTTINPKYSPKIQSLKDFGITYDMATKKALNIYTGANNWCFWDNGNKDHLVGLADGENNLVVFRLDKTASSLELRVDNTGTPAFYAIK
jgi:hypothetical protein